MKIMSIIQAVVLALLIVAGLAALFYYPDYWEWLLLGMLAIAIAGALFIRRQTIRSDWPFLLHIIVLVGSVFIFLFFLKTGLIQWLVLVGCFVILALHFYNLGKKRISLEIGQLVNLVTVFVLVYSVNSLTLIFELPDWQLILVIFGGIMILIYAWLPRKQGGRVKSLFYTLILAMVIAQVYWVLSFWPLTILVNTILVLLFYYVLSNIAISYLWKQLDSKRIWQYIVIAGALAVMVLATANWTMIF